MPFTKKPKVPLPKSNELKLYGDNEELSRELVDYRYILSRQIDACRHLLTVARSMQGLADAYKGVNVLEAMLMPFKGNKKFGEEMKTLIELHNKRQKKLNRRDFDLLQSDLAHDFILGKFRRLLSFASRIGITYIEKETIDIP